MHLYFIGTLLIIIAVAGLSAWIFLILLDFFGLRGRVKESEVKFRVQVSNLNKMAVNLNLAPIIEQALAQKVEFYRVSLEVDFNPAKKTKFVSGKIIVRLAPPPFNSIALPTIYSIAPLKVDSETKITTKYAINPEFKLTELPFGLSASVTQMKEYTRLHSNIVGHPGKHTVSWDFRATDTIDSIEGVQFLEFIVRQPANMKSDWQANSEGELKWRDHLISFARNMDSRNIIEPFSVPDQ